jgi:hypothetical protein
MEAEIIIPGLLAVVSIAIGVYVLIWGIRKRKHLRKVCTEKTEGIVYEYRVKIYKQRNSDNEIVEKQHYYPVFKYTVDGTTYVKQSDEASSRKRLKEGLKVTICYNPENHSEYCVPADKMAYGYTRHVLFCIAILAFGAICFVYLISALS